VFFFKQYCCFIAATQKPNDRNSVLNLGEEIGFWQKCLLWV